MEIVDLFSRKTFFDLYNEFNHFIFTSKYYLPSCRPQDRNMAHVAMLWLVLMATSNVQDVVTRRWEKTPAFSRKTVTFAKGLPLILQFATPTYREWKSKEKKLVSSYPAAILVDPSHVSVLGKVEGDKVLQSETTPAAKKNKCSDSPKPSASKKSSTSSRPSADDLKKLDDKWAERFSWLEAMLLAKSFTVPVEPAVKPAAEVTTCQKPFLTLVLASAVWLERVLVPALFRPPVRL